MGRRVTLHVALLAAFVAGSAGATVQTANEQRGFAPEKSYEIGEVDHVNLFNGNLLLSVPLGTESPVGDGLSYRFQLAYNAKVWDHEVREVMTPDQMLSLTAAELATDFNAGVGWQVSLGRLVPPLTERNESKAQWMFVSQDGAEHMFWETLHDGEASVANVFYTRDGGYLRLKRSGATATVEQGDGLRWSFSSGTSCPSCQGGEWRLDRIDDRFGNAITIYHEGTTSSPVWRIVDSAGRTQRVEMSLRVLGSKFVPTINRIVLQGFGGADAVWTFTYQAATIDRPSSDNDPATAATVSASFLVAVQAPDGSQWGMPLAPEAERSYVLTKTEASGYGRMPGMIKRLRLPTLARIEWDWSGWAFPGTECEPGGGRGNRYLSASPGVAARRLVGTNGVVQGTWTYTHDLEDWQVVCQRIYESTTTVVDPVGNTTVHYFDIDQGVTGLGLTSYGLPYTPKVSDARDGTTRYLSRRVYEGASTLKREVFVAYAWDAKSSWWVDRNNTDANRRVASELTVYRDDLISTGNHAWSATYHENFDGLGHYRLVRNGGNFPFTGSFGSGNDRQRHTNYNPTVGQYPGSFVPPASSAAWVLGTYDFAWEKQGTVYAKTEACFDSATGRLKRQRTLRLGTGARSSTDVVVTYDRTATATGRNETEKWYGGDAQALDTASTLCAMPLPATPRTTLAHVYVGGSLASSRHAGAPHYLERRTIDSSTGLPAVTFDVAGISTTHQYDGLGRLTCSAPQAGHGAGIKVQYTPAVWSTKALASVEVSERQVVTPSTCALASTTLSRQKYLFDEHGRLKTEERLMPDAVWARRSTSYDVLGRVTAKSEWSSAATPANKTVFRNFDFAGRPRAVDSPDLKTTTIAYTGDRIVSRTYSIGTGFTSAGALILTSATTKEHYDREGRLRKVEPPVAAGTAPAIYDYDVGNRLARVAMTGSGVTQVRTFTYDQRGFLVSELQPEANRIDYVSYDARGQLLRRTQVSGADVSFVYDPYERLTEVKLTSGRRLKGFTYGTTNGTGDYRLGKVVSGTRHNWVRLPWSSGTETEVQVTEATVYGGIGGRPSRVTTSLASAHGYFGGESFITQWTYGDRGDVTRLTYPRCAHGLCDVAATGDPARNVDFTYDQGWLEVVSGYGTINYHPNGAVFRVYHTNSRRDVFDPDPHQMPRPANVRLVDNTNGTLMAELGAHAYDPVGNLVKRGGERYSYDVAGRLVRYKSSTPSYQAYQYDAFGNITQFTTSTDGTSACGGNVECRTLLTNPATNRLSSASYDAAGNLVSLSPHSQTWDALGTLVQRGIQAETYLYTAGDERIYTGFALTDRTVPRMASEVWTLRDQSAEVLTIYTTNGQRTSGAWQWKEDYIYRGRALLATATAASGLLHISVDHLGTPRATTNAAGTLVSSRHYWGYGQDLGTGGGDPETKRFTGHERDLRLDGTADDLDYVHARYYSPMWGRFLSVDPLGSARPSSPQSWNQYGYALNNPIMYIDPDGRESASYRIDAEVEAYMKHGIEPSWHDPTLVAGAMIATSVLTPVDETTLLAAGVGRIADGAARLGLSYRISMASRSAVAGVRLEATVARALGREVTSFRRTVSSGGRLVGDVDIETSKAIIEVASGGGKGKTRQLQTLLSDRNLNPAGKTVILFGPNVKPSVARAANRLGVKVFRDIDSLRLYLSRL